MNLRKILRLCRFLVERELSNLRDYNKLMGVLERNSDVHVGKGVRILGNPGSLKLGRGSRIDDGAVLDFRVGGELVVGENCTVRSGAILSPQGGFIHIGNNSGVNHYTILYGHGGLTIGEYVRFAAHSLVIPANHGFAKNGLPITNQPLTKKGIKIGNDVWVGGGCTILDGVAVGDGAVIAAGAVVTKDVEVDTVVAGVPAKTISRRR